jgi:hypothetical protein
MDDQRQFTANYVEGVSKFQSARNRAFWEETLSVLRGKSVELLSFDEIRKRLRLREEHYRGLQDIAVAKIAGSVGRYNDFTRTFLPKSNELKERWSRVYAQANSMTGLPPIEVYQVGDVYFVRDGNHRVSVARALGAATIQAHVTELPTSVTFSANMSAQEVSAAAAAAAFQEETGLKRTRPHHQPIQLSEPTRYPELLAHIYLHGKIMGEALGYPVSAEDAAADWYDRVYRPAVTLVRKYGILELVGDQKRTEADVYLWMVDHLRDVRDTLGEKEPRFSMALVDYLDRRAIDVPEELLTEKRDTLIMSRRHLLEKLRAQEEAEAAGAAAEPQADE